MKIKSKTPNIKIDLQDLMLYRAHEILLVASPYDAFVLEEDGRLTEQIINEYLAMNFYESPRLWRAETGKDAFKLIKKLDFDVIILMMRLDDMDFMHLCSKIRESYPEKPIILLVFDMYEVERIPSDTLYNNIDKVFVWKGNSNVFPAIMKSIEDSKNAYRDINNGGVRTIIFIEDNPHYYSMILPLLYKEIMFHTKNLISSSLDATNRLLHLRGRTKILLANTYEQAEEFFSLYRDNTLGIISDVRFPKNGKIDISAGLKFSKYIRELEPYMPVIIQSSNLEYSKKVQNVNADFLYKHSKTLLKDLRKFMLVHFGFGDFIFRDANGNEISKSISIKSLVENLKTIPEQSLIFHSKYNHFSNWLANRGEFNIASKIRPVNIEDFSNTEDLRIYLIRSINSSLKRKKGKGIINFSSHKLEDNTPFLRIGKGSLGGKARGLLFIQRTIANSKVNDSYPDVNIKIPKTIVIGTNEFDKFINENGLLEQAINLNSNLDIINLFLSKSLSNELVKSLSEFLENNHFTIALR
jgi:CheY-like chemotaxis protein